MIAARARDHQRHSDDRDTQLTRQARRRRPRISHWWGRRWFDHKNGAWCYLCDEFIATWSRRWPITEQARWEIDWHREQHLRGLLDTPTTNPRS